ncbi:replication factor C subunit 1 [Pieris napi]|uniref:replication factor C subunit 1 n=1 Tax=Pieris napi TaxID=78633 RepID=UPI001FBB4231|nr:replication factor C subunit 1 [Pieris napi]
MSKSIRSYFTVIKKQTTKIADDDSDIIPESPEIQVKKKKQTKKRRIEDSDEEIFSPKKKKVDTEQKSAHKSPKLKEVTITDLFGSGKIKKTESLVVKNKSEKQTEIGIHSDEEFEQSLLELDTIDNISPGKVKSHKDNQEKDIARDEPKSNKDVPKVKISPPQLSLTEDKREVKPKKHHETETKLKEKNDKRTDNDQNKNSKKQNKNDKIIEIADDDEHEEKVIGHKINNSSVAEKPHAINKSKIRKRDLSSFLEEDDDHDTSFKKKKHDDSLNESALSDQERHERKRLSASLYQKYLNRTGPKNLGAKEIPEGAPDCLKDCAFLLTGVLDSFEREEIIDAITKYGGSVKSGVSKKVTHVLAGEDSGPAKTAKAESLGIKIINEDQFLNMITELSKKNKNKKSNTNDKPKIKMEKSDKNKSPKDEKSKRNHDKMSKDKSKESLNAKVKKDRSVSPTALNNDKSVSLKNPIKKERSVSPKANITLKNDKSVSLKNPIKKERSVSPKPKIKKEILDSYGKLKTKKSEEEVEQIDNVEKSSKDASLMWVDKYKPQSIKQIIGQHGEASNVKKLINWLTKWYVNRKAKLPKPNPWAKNDDGGYYKAALLSGPPGVGKTTTVGLVCKELGFDTVEFNASDTRSKNLIKEQISELISSTSLSGYAKGVTGKQAVTKKHVLVMDEVDGMAGNEDRGGLQELISLIKSSSVPVICMCNDRNSEKMRSLVNYCYDLRFSRPRVDQIKAAMMTICFKEGVKVPGDVLSQLISAAGQDIRQTLHLLSVWTADPTLTEHDKLQKEVQRVKKDIKMGPWDAIRKVFSAEEHKTMSIIDRSDLFFTDYSLAPLFVHENYPQVVPHCPKHEVLDRMSKAVDSISLGDLVDSRIRSNQAWSLLPLQAMYSSVIPGQQLSGHIGGQIQFPSWLGKNSRANKMSRLAQTIHAHTRLSTSGSKSSIFLDYSSHLRDAILNPLIKDKNEGISKSLQVLEEYHLLRDDLESLTELSLWPGQRNPSILIDAKVKAAMTRTYNKQASALPYAPGAIKKAKHLDTDENGLEMDAEDDVENDSDPENDLLIKKKKMKDLEKASNSKEKPQSSKGKGKKTK